MTQNIRSYYGKWTSLRNMVWGIVICFSVDSLMITLALIERVGMCLYCYVA